MSQFNYTVGDLVKLCVRFQDPDTNAYLQGSQVTCEIIPPNGTPTTIGTQFDPNLHTKDDAGDITAPGHFAEVTADAPGKWYYRLASTGNVQGAKEGSFLVGRSSFPV